ncbi:iron-sulfur cluster assembly scaffold protein [Sulfurimonas lithotrophica]|uniref:Iron-sulfur cluster assembly scaffold protein n=1 Tax=Sulfurimonas lithotrophica TaxID=2590022 RepID=A0A5P8P309_9BACT|nr:iron-sulfur cluster assembly scaffold protein [Sulfurimonas lithotrophica]QFR50065.1 iron-sulfur cluster assembly scaffold protein [Sulfurimonas lithotrophica]
MLENVKMPEGINKDVMEHLMYPKNYGKLENPTCVGVAMDEKTGEYVIFYTLLEGDVIKDVKFATNGCQDTVVVGSMYTDMIKGETTEYANKALGLIAKKLGSDMTRQQEICAEMVLNGFVASMMNLENIQNGKDEEMHVLKMKESCEVEEEKQ